MSTQGATPRITLWSVLPNSLRVALALASVTSLLAGALLFRSDISQGPSDITASNDAPDAPVLGSGDFSLTTPLTPAPATGKPRSEAVIRVPGADEENGARAQGFPTFGRYVYKVTGSEQGAAFTKRPLPTEMTMTVHREQPSEGGVPPLEPTELVFDLDYSAERHERQIVAYTPDGMAFTYENLQIALAASSFGGEATFDPAVLQIPADLAESEVVEGTSTVSGADGSTSRVEDWTVAVEGREEIEDRGETINAWVVNMGRKSRPGSGDRFSRTRRYYFSPDTGLWVSFTDTTTIRRGSGLGATTYSSQVHATLDRVEPL